MSKPVNAAFFKAASAIYKRVGPPVDNFLMTISGGSLTLQVGQPIGTLHTTGRKSGVARASSVLCIPDDDRFSLVASNFGGQKRPAWYLNLVANPEVRLTYHGQTKAYRARITTGQEREQLWQTKCLKQLAGFAVYQDMAGERIIPVVALEPKSTA